MENATEDTSDFKRLIDESELRYVHCCGTCGNALVGAGHGLVNCLELHISDLPFLCRCNRWKYGKGAKLDGLKEDADLKELDDARKSGDGVVFPCPKCAHRVYNMQMPTKNGFEAWGCEKDCSTNCMKDFIGKPECPHFDEGDSLAMWF